MAGAVVEIFASKGEGFPQIRIFPQRKPLTFVVNRGDFRIQSYDLNRISSNGHRGAPVLWHGAYGNEKPGVFATFTESKRNLLGFIHVIRHQTHRVMD